MPPWLADIPDWVRCVILVGVALIVFVVIFKGLMEPTERR